MTENPTRPGAIRKGPTALILSCLVLSGCTEWSIFYKPQVDVARMQRDATQCEVQALRDAPVANQIRQTGSLGIGYGYGYLAGGGIYSVDVNQDLRNRVMTYCMADLGYSPITVPDCPESVARAVPARQTVALPQVTSDTCVIRYPDGQFQLVNQG